MDAKPNLELPKRTAAKRAIFDRRSTFFAVCTLILFGVVIALLLREPAARTAAPEAQGDLSADELRSLAMRLEDRNLPAVAAETWQGYLQAAALPDAEAGTIHYRIGKLHQSAEQYDRAIAAFYQAEALLGGADEKLTHEINVRTRDCFIKLGQYGDLDRDLAERTSLQEDEPTDLAGQQVVAQIGAERITLADFDRMLKQDIDLALKAMPGLPPEQEDAYRKRIAQQFADPQARMRKLQELVSVKVLARKAREDELHKTDDFRRRVAEMSDMLLANKLLTDEVGKRATVTLEDYKRYYEANKQQYVEPGRARIAHIACKDKEQAAALIKEIGKGTSFEEAAKKHSLDAATKGEGGAIARPVQEVSKQIPRIGRDEALHKAIFDAEPPVVLKDPYKGSDGQWHVVKVLEKTETRQLSLDEAADRVRADTRRARTQEVTEQFIQGLFEKADVKFYPEAFAARASSTRPASTQPDPKEE